MVPDRPPIPPIDLIARVVPPFAAEGADQVKESFDREAMRSVQALERALASVGHRLEDFPRILDFGCGVGRVLRHLGGLGQVCSLHGVDIDHEMVAWCKANIPYADFTVGDHEPPLPYPDGSFDLVFNHSVFTHLDERRQDQWLAEIRRVLTPGGIALLTVHSTRQWNDNLRWIAGGGEDGERYRRQLERDGILFIAEDHFVGSTHPEWYHSTFHAPWYVHEHWGQFLAVRAYIHEGSDTQDMVIVENPSAGQGLDRPIGHASAAPPPANPSPATLPGGPSPGASAQKLRQSLLKLRSVLARRLAGDGTHWRQAAGELAAVRTKVDELVAERRSIKMLRASIHVQAERITAIESELRGRLDALSARNDAGND